MSDLSPPAPPQVSPDGKFYWDGQHWVPMQKSQGTPAAPAQSSPPLGAPPRQFSADGMWEWNGSQWISTQSPPVPQPVAQSTPFVPAGGAAETPQGVQVKQKKGHLVRNLGIVAGALLLIGIGGAIASSGNFKKNPTDGSTTASSPTPASSPSTAPAASSTYNLPIGSTITMTNTSSGDSWDVTVNSVKRFTSSNQFETPTARYHFIVINVSYKATTGSADTNPFDWEAKDPSGSVSPTGFATQTLPATTVTAPNTVRGTVVLEIPNRSGGTVVYSSGFSEQASWAFTAADVA